MNLFKFEFLKKGAQLLAVAAVQAESAVDETLPERRSEGARLARQDVDVQSAQADRRRRRTRPSLPRTVLRSRRRGIYTPSPH